MEKLAPHPKIQEGEKILLFSFQNYEKVLRFF